MRTRKLRVRKSLVRLTFLGCANYTSLPAGLATASKIAPHQSLQLNQSVSHFLDPVASTLGVRGQT